MTEEKSTSDAEKAFGKNSHRGEGRTRVMNKKGVANYIVGLFAGGLALLLFSGCSFFHDKGEFVQNPTPEQLKEFVGSIRPYGGDAKYHYSFACYLQKRGKHRLAIQEFREAIKVTPTFAKAYNGLGISYDAMGKYPRAVKAYRTALALKPDLDYAWNNLGYSYLLQGDTDAAVAALKKATALDMHNRQFHNNLALAYGRKGLFDRAFAEFRAAQGALKAHYNIAQLYYEHHDYEKAGKHYARCLGVSSPSLRAREGSKASKAMASIVVKEEPSVAARSVTAPAIPAPEKTQADKTQTVIKDSPKARTAANPCDLRQLAAREVEISNGNGVRHMAKRVGDYLQEKGVRRPLLTNADHFNHQKTMIYYRRGYLQQAYQLAKLFPGYQEMEVTRKFSHGRTKMKVVIGKDLVSQTLSEKRESGDLS
jgi:tetratricopeptide (TPR) repeat protein